MHFSGIGQNIDSFNSMNVIVTSSNLSELDEFDIDSMKKYFLMR